MPRELGFLWAGAFVNYASLFTASLLTTYYGLGVWDGLIATALGTLAAAVILGLLSNTGPRTGLPQIVYTRRIFGLRGSYLGAALTLFLAIGWFAVDCSRYSAKITCVPRARKDFQTARCCTGTRCAIWPFHW